MSNTNNVPALQRAYNVIVTLLGSPWPMGISELARELGLSKSTVHGLVHTLDNLGLLEKEAENGKRFRPAGPLLDLWREALIKGHLSKAARPLLSMFSERHGLTALAGVFLHARVLIVDAVLAPGLGVSAYVGQLLPAWAGALGKALLATLPPDRLRTMAPKMAARSPLGLKAYMSDIEQVRETGVAVDREEYLPGVRALAASVPPGDPLKPLGAVWAVGLTPSLADARLEVVAGELRTLADEIGWRIDELEAGSNADRG